MRILDILGNEVVVLFNVIAEDGKVYERELNGESLSSGIYFYQLATQSKTESRKMLLLK